MRVLAINGSARKEGNTSIAIDAVLNPLKKENILTEVVELSGKKIRGCTACYKCKQNLDKKCVINDDLNEIIEKMLEADAIILASPTYFADMSTELKAVIDRSGVVARCNGNMFRRKIGAAVVVGRRGGPVNAFDNINNFFLIEEMIIPGSNYWNIVFGGAKGSAAEDEEGLKTMKVLGENISWLLNKIVE